MITSQIPETCRYTKDHEWMTITGNVARVGITDYAQQKLGDIVFVELPELTRPVKAKASFAVVESVKAASDVYAPVSGQIVAVNMALSDDPALVNRDPYGQGYLIEIKNFDMKEYQQLLSPAEYRQHLAQEGE